MVALGVDFAAIDGNAPPNFEHARAAPPIGAGLKFVYLKRTQHIYQDAHYVRDAARARYTGLVVGAYHYPGWGPRASSAKAQVAAFRSAPGDVVPSSDLPPAIDFEGFEKCGWVPQQVVDFVRQLVLEFESQMQVTPVIYTSFNQYDALQRPAIPWAARCALWVKTAYRHPARAPYDASPPKHEPHTGIDSRDPGNYYRIPDPWTNWWLHQVDGDALGVPGFTSTVDVDRFREVAAPVGDTFETGGHIAWLQGKLGVAADGVYGQDTENAVRALQTRCGLPVTGAVDVTTFAAAAWLPRR